MKRFPYLAFTVDVQTNASKDDFEFKNGKWIWKCPKREKQVAACRASTVNIFLEHFGALNKIHRTTHTCTGFPSATIFAKGGKDFDKPKGCSQSKAETMALHAVADAKTKLSIVWHKDRINKAIVKNAAPLMGSKSYAAYTSAMTHYDAEKAVVHVQKKAVKKAIKAKTDTKVDCKKWKKDSAVNAQIQDVLKKPIHFKANMCDLRDKAAEDKVKQIAEILKKWPKLAITVDGQTAGKNQSAGTCEFGKAFTDQKGKPIGIHQLAKCRADVVKSVLKASGVTADITTSGHPCTGYIGTKIYATGSGGGSGGKKPSGC